MQVRPAVILDQSAYWRVYCRFGWDRVCPDCLAKDGESILGTKLLDRKRKAAESWLKSTSAPGVWTEHVSCPVKPACVDWPEGRLFTAPAPPADWANPQFDDSQWPRTKNAAVGWGDDLRRQALYLRTRLLVDEPGKAGDLALRLTYRGGARVLVNGMEVFRGHLPKGELSPEAPGEHYPMEAYVLLPDECLPEWLPKGQVQPPLRPIFCPELPERYDDTDVQFPAKAGAPEYRRGVGFGYAVFNRKAWDRVRPLRNRDSSQVAIPAKVLRKGVNVLAVEIHASRLHPVVLAPNKEQNGWDYVYYNGKWSHARLLTLEVSGGSGAVAPALSRPPGTQVWVEDVHDRLHLPDFLQPGEPPGTVRIAGVPNGTHSAQVAIGTSVALSDPKVTISDLTATQGQAVIPASAGRAFFMAPLPLAWLGTLGGNRGYDVYSLNPLDQVAGPDFARYSSLRLADLPQADRARKAKEETERISFFDHVSAAACRRIAANACQPIWLTWRIPANTPAGAYRGQVRLEAGGMPPTNVPVELDVLGWRVPDPRDFQTVVAMEQSPYGVARQYNVPLWSEEHFRRMEGSFRQLARVGGDWLNVPVIDKTEFGNGTDSPIRWIRKKDGTLAFDYAILDRYLDLACKHLGTPRIINFAVVQGERHVPIPSAVTVRDESAGKATTQPLGGKEVSPAEYRKVWHAFAKALFEHMKAKGLEKSMYWGFRWDTEGDPELKTVLAEAVPDVYWVCAGHTGVLKDSYHNSGTKDYSFYKVSCTIYYPALRRPGWKNEYLHLATPRGNSTVHGLDGSSPAFAFRLTADRALYWGRNGVGRMGADYGGVYFNPSWYPSPGFGVVNILWPGPDGFESSARFEAFLEGIQETEARIFIEQALDRGLLPGELAKRLSAVLADHHDQTTVVPCSFAIFPEGEYHCFWQEQSRRLFQAAAEAAGAVAMDVYPPSLNVTLAPEGKTRVAVKVRNWTARPRTWKAAGSEPWIVPDKAEGAVEGAAEVVVQLDGSRIGAGKAATGTLTVQDAQTGRSFAVKIDAAVPAAK